MYFFPVYALMRMGRKFDSKRFWKMFLLVDWVMKSATLLLQVFNVACADTGLCHACCCALHSMLSWCTRSAASSTADLTYDLLVHLRQRLLWSGSVVQQMIDFICDNWDDPVDVSESLVELNCSIRYIVEAKWSYSFFSHSHACTTHTHAFTHAYTHPRTKTYTAILPALARAMCWATCGKWAKQDLSRHPATVHPGNMAQPL